MEPTPSPAVDPSADQLKPRKIFCNAKTGLYGWRCRVCPDARAGGFDSASDAAESFNIHAARKIHQKHLAARQLNREMAAGRGHATDG